jgi:hypothetical protein
VRSSFKIVYEVNPHAQLDIAYVLDLKRVHVKDRELFAQIQEIHMMTTQNMQESTAKYKANANKKNVSHVPHIYLAIISFSSYGMILYYSYRYLVISRMIIVSFFSFSLIVVIADIQPCN